MFLSPCICLSLSCVCRWEDAYFSCGVPLVSFLRLVVGPVCVLRRFGITTQKYNVTLVHSFVLPTTPPPQIFSPFLLALYLPICWQNVCMLMVCDVGKVVGLKKNKKAKEKNLFCVPCVFFEAPPVSLTACHFRISVCNFPAKKKMESQRPLRIKWFHRIFVIVLCFCVQKVLQLLC